MTLLPINSPKNTVIQIQPMLTKAIMNVNIFIRKPCLVETTPLLLLRYFLASLDEVKIKVSVIDYYINCDILLLVLIVFVITALYIINT